jgi:hypothetical protein
MGHVVLALVVLLMRACSAAAEANYSQTKLDKPVGMLSSNFDRIFISV